MTKKVINKVITIAKTLFIFFRTKKFTTGWSTIAKMMEKTTGIIIPLAMYMIASKAHKPMTKTDAFVKSGNFNLSSVTALWNSFFFYGQ